MRTSKARRGYRHGSHLKQRDGIWYAYFPEKKGSVSLKTKDRAEAEREFRKRLAEAGHDDVGQPALQEDTLVNIAQAYLDAPHGWTKETERTARNRIVAFGKWCEQRGVRYASGITEPVMDAWIRERENDVSRRTINRDMRTAKRCIAFGVARGLCNPCPALTKRPYVREPRRSKVRYVPDVTEAARAFDVLESLHQGACLAAKSLYATGLRIEELRRLTIFDVRGGAVHVRPEAGPAAEAAPTKGYRERAIPVAPTVETLVREFLSWRTGKRVGCTQGWLIKKLHKACDQARVPRFGLHDLRAAFATEAFDGGVGLVVIQRWLGHADPQTTQAYIRPRRSDSRVTAPIPGGLGDCTKLHKDGVTLGPFGSTRPKSDRG